MKFNYPSTNLEAIPFLCPTDKLVEKAINVLLFGKMFGIFSFFFGFTFHIQNENRRGIKRLRIIWRMLMLMLFGIFNALFIPMGDILIFNSLIGIFITPILFFKTRILFCIAIFLLLQPIEMYEWGYSYFGHNFTPSLTCFTKLETNIKHTLLTGNFWEITKINFIKGIPASLCWEFLSGRLMQVSGLVILGIVAARNNFFLASKYGRKFWLKALMVFGFAIGILWLFKKYIIESLNIIGMEQLRILFSLWINTLATLFIISVFIFLYYSTKGRFFHSFTYLGKMSLSNYIAQSIVGAFLFSSYGLHLPNTIGVTYSILLTIILIFIQITLSKAWLHKHQKGPLESLWFYLTWVDKKK